VGNVALATAAEAVRSAWLNSLLYGFTGPTDVRSRVRPPP